MIILFIVAMVLYCICPLPIQLIVLVINLFSFDSLPYIDEFIMFCSTAGKINKINSIVSFLEDHPAIIKTLVVILIVGLVLWFGIFIKTGIEVIFG